MRNNEFVGEDVSNKNRLNVSYSMSLSPPNCPSKRNSPNYVDNISLKKHKTSTNKSACQVSFGTYFSILHEIKLLYLMNK